MNSKSFTVFISVILLGFSLVVCISCKDENVTAQSTSNSAAETKATSSRELTKAVKENEYEKVKILLGRGADSNAKDDSGSSLTQIAIQNKYTDILDLLLEHGADIKGNSKPSPLELALLADKDEMVVTLIQHGADVNFKIAGDRSILMDAIIKGKKNVARILLDHGATVNVPNRLGRTELFYVDGNSRDLVRLLIEKGSDPNHQDGDGATPLFFAIQANDSLLVRQFVELGANVNAHDKYGWTPMKDALIFGCNDIIEVLQQNGATID